MIERLPLLLVAAVLLITGAVQDGGVSESVLAAGLVVLGAWVAVEVEHLWQQHRKDER